MPVTDRREMFEPPAWIRACLVGGTLMATLAASATASPIAAPSTQSGPERWTPLDQPPGQSQGALLLDISNDRLVAFGGDPTAGPAFTSSEVWVRPLSGTSWQRLPTVGTPPPPPGAPTIGIYDPIRQRMLCSSGTSVGGPMEVWSLTLDATPTWTQLTTSGTPPFFHYSHHAIYDPVRDRMVVVQEDATVLALDLSGPSMWSTLVSAPNFRKEHSVVYDVNRDQLIRFGGCMTSGCYETYAYSNETYVCPLSGTPAWTLLTVPGTLPPGLKEHVAVFDPSRDRMTVLFGTGATGANTQVWALDLNAGPGWVAIPTTGGPAGRVWCSAVLDESRDRILGYGGTRSTALREAWSLTLAAPNTWTVFNDPSPGGRQGHTAVFDAVRNRMLLFGGFDGASFHNDVWQVPNATRAWSLVTTAGTPPTARYSHDAIYDPVGDRMIVFGGYDGSSCRNDVYALSLAGTPTWSVLSPAGTKPAGRAQAAAAYDSVRRRLVVFGGQLCDDTFLGDTWALSLAPGGTWTELGTGVHPDPRRNPSLVADPRRDRLVLFAGTGAGTPYADTWTLSLSNPTSWTALPPQAAYPGPRYGHVGIYDPVRGGVVIYGGETDLGPAGDVWELYSLGDQWVRLDPPIVPKGRRFHSGAYDPEGARLLVYGGMFSITYLQELWSLSLPAQTAVDEPEVAPTLGLSAAPNPARAGFVVSFVLPRATDVRIDVFDLAGRRVARLMNAEVTSGAHRVSWDGRNDAGRAIAPGVYRVRLNAPGDVRTATIVAIR